MIGRKTKLIIFERQLWPQPPFNSEPYWCLINTLIFHGDGKEVWRQEIPEADVIRLHPEIGPPYEIVRPGSVEVIRQRKWGWVLHIEYRHEDAERVWALAFQRQLDKMAEEGSA